MSKNYKKKRNQETISASSEKTLSKKEIYDLNKKKKEESKNKELAKKNKSKKKKRKNATYKTNLLGRIFAILMLLLMVGSIIATATAYIG